MSELPVTEPSATPLPVEPRRRRWPWWLLGLFILIVLLWVGYWGAARTAAGMALARIGEGPVGDAQIACTQPALGGFPFNLNITCETASVATPTGVTASIGSIAATAPLYWPGALSANLASPLKVSLPGFDLDGAWKEGTASVNLGIGGLNGFDARLDWLEATGTSALAPPPVSRISAAVANAAVAPAGGNDFAVNLNADTLRLTQANGTTLPDLDISAKVKLVDVGSSLGRDPVATLLAWLRKGATAEIEDLRLSGEGATLATSGKLTIDTQGRLSGGLLLRWNDIAKVADLIEAIRPGSRDRLQAPLQMINAFSLQTETPEGTFRQASLGLVNGTVVYNMIPLPIDPIPPIQF